MWETFLDFSLFEIVDNLITLWGNLSFPALFIEIFRSGGWLVYFFPCFYLLKELWLYHVEEQYCEHRHFVVLAIDVPRDNEQSPKAVENIFSTLSALASPNNFVEKYWKGEVQEKISFEIVSIDGYVQFLIHCNEKIKDLVESVFYAQYPTLEITEVEDYTKAAPVTFPDSEYEMFGTELITAKHAVYPIRTYEEFEHALSQALKDPMASLLESMSRLQIGEQIWIQLLVTPHPGDDWKEKCKEEIDVFLKKTPHAHSGFLFQVIMAPFNVIVFILEGILSIFDISFAAEEDAHAAKSVDGMKISELTPGGKEQLKQMEKKMTKIGFDVKLRILYIARREVFSKIRGVAAVLGAIRQYNTLNLNAFKPDKRVATKVQYFFKKTRVAARQRKFMKAYRARSWSTGSTPFILNTEELATIFHFPDISVKAPLLKRTVTKKSEPPLGLPIHVGEEIIPGMMIKPTEAERKSAAASKIASDETQIREMEDYFSLDSEVPELLEPAEDEAKKAEPPANLPIA
ncbi:MAG: hypothetical protein G01um101418_76 [Parcubacteria group bacterium Gr01-1014_18]|nr:MAG: hypothetical protein Greene041636_76 [Parcubacteria group bacterium Greene0416_36]TSC81582.1 MAG: hypothetical protein G01um101418_76 [Parcubacteria group bacterium Gr01-1014_18]TSC99607.1 MAG: hypothetical protein Greene101420_11 [Parcubacteria group bacterium Greene1014_20]TSD07058.1 MAG: hypothetical protein Greene07142_370 [Parcubacteria group bacterium Greene0714_2]